jgi:hypothetical protein
MGKTIVTRLKDYPVVNGDFSVTHHFMDKYDSNMFFDMLVTCWKALVFI